MKLNPAAVYDQDTWVKSFPNVSLSGVQEKTLNIGMNTFDSYDLPDVNLEIKDVSSGGMFTKKNTKSLVISASFTPYVFTGIITVHIFGSLCVIGSYKLIEGQAIFETSQNIEEKKANLFRKIGNVESMDYFSALDKSVDFVVRTMVDNIEELL